MLPVDREFEIMLCSCHRARGIVASFILIMDRVRESCPGDTKFRNYVSDGVCKLGEIMIPIPILIHMFWK